MLGFPIKKYLYSAYKFEEQTKNLISTQEEFLFSKLHKNSQTEYGEKYGFGSIQSVKQFQESVPIIVYDDISESIERVKDGEENVLTKQSPIRFVTTSGTTGAQKFIPITPDFLKEYVNSWNIWITHVVAQHRKIPLGKTLSFISPSIEGYTKSGVPFGSMTGLTQESQHLISKLFYAVPKKVFNIPYLSIIIKEYILSIFSPAES